MLDYLGEQSFNSQFSARPLKRVIQCVILKGILSGKFSKAAVLEDDAVHFENVELPIV